MSHEATVPDPGVLRPPDDADVNSDEVVERLLRAVREHLDLDVAFVGQVVGGERVFRYLDAKPGENVIAAGDADPAEESYCLYVLKGDLPSLLRDPMDHPLAARLRATSQLPVGSHISVPIQFSDGRVYGTFCCFAHDVRPSLGAETVRAVRMMAELAGEYLEAIDAAQAEQHRRRELVEAVLEDPDGMTLVFQPLRNLATMEIVGLEALARFPGHDQGPAWFFSEAAAAGLGIPAEMRAVSMALEVLDRIPEPVRLNVNVSPDTFYSQAFFDAVAAVPGHRLVVEVTEHAVIEDYAEMKAASARLADLGIWLAIDDVGMGFSGLNRILESAPEELKLDASVIRDVHVNTVKQALVEAFCSFGERAGFDIVAEGIESAAELDSVRALGVKIGQGYHLGRPDRLDRVIPGEEPIEEETCSRSSP